MVVVVVLVVSLTARALPSATIIELFAGGMMPDGAMFSAPPAALHVGLAHKASRSPWINLASATNVLLFLDLMTHFMSGLRGAHSQVSYQIDYMPLVGSSTTCSCNWSCCVLKLHQSHGNTYTRQVKGLRASAEQASRHSLRWQRTPWRSPGAAIPCPLATGSLARCAALFRYIGQQWRDACTGSQQACMAGRHWCSWQWRSLMAWG